MQPAVESWAITNLGNACVLVEVGDATVLTDPFVNPSPGISDVPMLRPDELPALTAIIGSHWAQDHWEIDSFSSYRYRESTPVYVSDPSMAERAVSAGFTTVEVLGWGDRRDLTDIVALEAIIEHVAADGMRTNNYGIVGPDARVFYGGEVLDIDAITSYADGAAAFDVAIGPVNGVVFRGRPLVTSASGMLAVARTLGAEHLVPIHDGHLAFEGMVEITSSACEFAQLDLTGVKLVQPMPGERIAPA
jgi:L-ascorbate metabolism protein UlaG (beta-lactamase superfamily)